MDEQRSSWAVIKSFGNSETERVFRGEIARRLPRDIQAVALRKLLVLHAATAVEELRTPLGNRLERLAGDRAGQMSLRVNDQWRICFRWEQGDAYDVEITDYH
jgi:proteic killer suppression protein